MSEATIKGNTFSLGEVSFEIDRTDPHKTLSAINNLKSADWQKMVAAAGLPVEPFDKTLARPVLLGILQNAWYKEVKGKVPESCVSGQTNRVARYKQQVEELKSAGAEDLVATTRKPKKAAGEQKDKVVFRVVLVGAKMKELEATTGQKRLMVNAFLAAKAVDTNKEHKGLSVADVAAAVADCTCCKSPKPSQVNCAFHINNWKNEGFLFVVNQSELPEPKSKKAQAPEGTAKTPAAPATPPAKKAAETPKKK